MRQGITHMNNALNRRRFSNTASVVLLLGLGTSLAAAAQWQMPEQQLEPVVEQIVKEANQNSQLKQLAHELLDVVGPRLVGTPQMKHAHEWAVNKYADWGIEEIGKAWGREKGCKDV